MSFMKKVADWFKITDVDDPGLGEEPDEVIEDGWDGPEYDEPERRGWFGFSKKKPENMVMYIDSPRSYADAQRIADRLIAGSAVVVNFGQFDEGSAQSVVDFISGCLYTLNRVSGTVFVFAPKDVRFDVKEDEAGNMSSNVG